MSKSITQDMAYRQSLMKYAEKYSVSRASRKYNKSRSYHLYSESSAGMAVQRPSPASPSDRTVTRTSTRKSYKIIKAFPMQETIDTCGKSYSTQAAIKNLWNHLDRFALELDIISKRASELFTSDPVPETSRLSFSEEEIETVWKHQSNPWVDIVLIMLYSGGRISEFLNLKPEDVDLKEGMMKGGNKTKVAKNRIVPIHPKIRDLVDRRLTEGGPRLICYNGKLFNQTQYRTFRADMMKTMNMSRTPHECRHTFETQLDSAEANRKCIDLLMWHVSKDTGNRVYNHKTLDELKATMELIP